MGAWRGHVENRRAIHIDPGFIQIRRHQPCDGVRRIKRSRRIILIEMRECPRGRIFSPLRRPHPLDAPAFLVHQNQKIIANAVTRTGYKARNLIARDTIAGKQDQPAGSDIAQER